ncbi:MFS transporter [Vulgatibacter incomptus]|uniref:Putative 3-phenylpropionic acid transporter n=1 Tax=Vulgatibacter incomptus TaxID=1391653 RepID=A0A0K1PAR1_9BACT|nr:MFS transporter [Vulgatibacter incomptus]AKU90628.1 putative 3-phenylpropionic acid transporter [Vulgatibacter incomptus]
MRLHLFYFLYYAAAGITTAYLPPYLRSIGLSGVELAVATSIQPLLMIVVPPVWGFAADRTRRTPQLLRIACSGAAIAFGLLHVVGRFAGVAGTIALYSLFATAIAALADSVAVPYARARGVDYAKIRVWGSIGFVVSSWTFSQWLSRGGGVSDAIVLASALMMAYAAASFRLVAEPGSVRGAPPDLREVRRLLQRPEVALFLGAAMFHWAALAPYHVFFAIHLGDLGADPSCIGLGFALAIAAEVAAMWHPLTSRLPAVPLLALAFGVGVARWTLTAFAPTGEMVAWLQLAHGVVYGVFFVASIGHLERLVPAHLLGTARALFSAVVFGIGGFFGNLLAGLLYDQGGGRLAFLAAAALDLVPLLLLVLAPRVARRTAPVATA